MAMSTRELSDRIEINDLLIRYARAIDAREWDLLDRVFTGDASIDYTSSGGVAGSYPEIKVWLAKALGQFTSYVHLLGNSAVTLDGDRASAETLVTNPMQVAADGQTHTFTVWAAYHDRLVRGADGWRIAERIEKQLLLEGSLPPSLSIPPK